MMSPGTVGGHLLHVLKDRRDREAQLTPYVRALCLLAARHEDEFQEIARLMCRRYDCDEEIER